MKRIIFTWGILLFFAPVIVRSQSKIAVKLKTTYFKFDLPDNLVDSANGQGIGNALAQTTSGSILYTLNGVEHIIGTPSYTDKDLFPIHFVNKDGTWKLDKLYTDVSIGIPRNYEFIDSTNIAYADHGREYGDPWPYGNIFTVKTQGDTLKWTKISQFKSFYHSVAVGDLNNDKKYDLIGLHMGSYNPWKGNNGLHPYLQEQNGNFINGDNIIEDRQPNVGGGSVLIADIMGDSQPEVLVGTYGGARFAFSVFSYDKDKNKYIFNKSPKDAGVFKDGQQGSTSLKLADFNKDGKIDLAIASEGYPGNQIQIWQGQGNGDFISGQLLNYDTTLSDGSKISLNSFREFEIADINKDGWLDIIVHPFASGSKFRINPGPMTAENPRGYFGTGIKLNSNIWINNSGIFNTLNEDLRVSDIYPGFIKGAYINGKLKYFGFEQAQSNNIKHAVKIHEMTVTFCKDLIKPKFNTSKVTFCDGDSLKLSISNINLGDTIKWYSGNSIEVGNAKTIKEALTLFAVRTDSLGCTISSDTITITKNNLPTLPVVKDTVFCQNSTPSVLIATAITDHVLSWYGTSISGSSGNSNASIAQTLDTNSLKYYVSQISSITGCESKKAVINVKINPTPPLPSLRDTFYCQNYNADTLRFNPTAGATVLWYGNNATGGNSTNLAIKPNTNTLGVSYFYVSQLFSNTGCESARKKIMVSVFPIPSVPTLSRDTSNSLISNALIGNTWYKDGTLITDTAQKFKPTSPGSYTVKTTQNGCVSAMSSPYYYLVTDIVRLNSGEFIKIAPNPFVNQIYLDFNIKGYSRLNVDVFELTTGNRVFSKQGLIAGTPIMLNELSSGTYIIKITSNDNKIVQQFKMLRM